MNIFEEIQKLKNSLSSDERELMQLLPEKLDDKAVIFWLNNTYTRAKNKSPAFNKLARLLAWELATHFESDPAKIPLVAFKYLYGRRVITSIQLSSTSSPINQLKFIDGKFLIASQQNDQYVLVSGKEWSKQSSTVLFELYEQALREKESIPQPTWAQTQAFQMLEECFDLPITAVDAYILKRKNRLSALMIDPLMASLPRMQAFWQAYETIYPSHTIKAAALTDMQYPENMGISVDENNTIKNDAKLQRRYQQAMQEKLNFQNISSEQNKIYEKINEAVDLPLDQGLEFIQNNRAMILAALDELPTDDQLHHIRSFWTRYEEVYYQASAMLIDNTLEQNRIKLAQNAGNTAVSNPREQFWRTLYPNIKGVYLGEAGNDHDWPNYGEALWVKRGQEEYLINYRKLVLMSQYTDVRALIMGQPLEKPYDPAIVAAVKNHPNYWPLSKEDRQRIKDFNQDYTFWEIQSIKTGLKCKNYYEFFNQMHLVFKRFNAHTQGTQFDDLFNNKSALNAIGPYIHLYDQPGFVQGLQNKLAQYSANPHSVEASGLQYLIDLKTNFFECFGSADHQLGEVLKDLKTLLENEVEFPTHPLEVIKPWNNTRIMGVDKIRPALSDTEQKLFKAQLDTVSEPKVLLELWGRAGQSTHTLIAQRFLELMHDQSMSLKRLSSLIDEFFSNASQFETKELLVKSLFSHGIPKGFYQENNVEDYVYALLLQTKYHINNTPLIIDDALKFLRQGPDNGLTFDELAPLIAIVTSHVPLEQLEFLKDIPTSNKTQWAKFLLLIEAEFFEQILHLFNAKLNNYFNESLLGEFIELVGALQSAPARQLSIIKIFFPSVANPAVNYIALAARDIFLDLSAPDYVHLIVMLTNFMGEPLENTYFVNGLCVALNAVESDKLPAVLEQLSAQNNAKFMLKINALQQDPNLIEQLLSNINSHKNKSMIIKWLVPDINALIKLNALESISENCLEILLSSDVVRECMGQIENIDQLLKVLNIFLYNKLYDYEQDDFNDFVKNIISPWIKTADDVLRLKELSPNQFDFVMKLLWGDFITQPQDLDKYFSPNLTAAQLRENCEKNYLSIDQCLAVLMYKRASFTPEDAAVLLRYFARPACEKVLNLYDLSSWPKDKTLLPILGLDSCVTQVVLQLLNHHFNFINFLNISNYFYPSDVFEFCRNLRSLNSDQQSALLTYMDCSLFLITYEDWCLLFDILDPSCRAVFLKHHPDRCESKFYDMTDFIKIKEIFESNRENALFWLNIIADKKLNLIPYRSLWLDKQLAHLAQLHTPCEQIAVKIFKKRPDLILLEIDGIRTLDVLKQRVWGARKDEIVPVLLNLCQQGLYPLNQSELEELLCFYPDSDYQNQILKILIARQCDSILMTDFDSLKSLIYFLRGFNNFEGVDIVLASIKDNVYKLDHFSQLEWLVNQPQYKLLAGELLTSVIAQQPEIIFLQVKALPMILNYLNDNLVKVLCEPLTRFKSIYKFLLSEQLLPTYNVIEDIDHTQVQGVKQILNSILGGSRSLEKAWNIALIPDEEARVYSAYVEAFEYGGIKTAETLEGETVYSKATLQYYVMNKTKTIKSDFRFEKAKAASTVTKPQNSVSAAKLAF